MLSLVVVEIMVLASSFFFIQRVFSTELQDAASMSVEEATAFSLIYGYPVLAYAQVVKPYFSSVGTNTGIVRPNFWPANTTNPVVRPNVDTLYITGLSDVSDTNLMFTYPEAKDDRYYSFSYYDFYGNNLFNLANTFNSSPGTYLLRPEGSGSCNDERSNVTAYIDSPTTYGFFVYRFFVKDKLNQSDFDVARRMQNASHIRAVERTHLSFADGAPAMSLSALNGALNAYSALGILQALARLTPFNLPVEKSDRARVKSILAKAGLQNGIYNQSQSVNITACEVIANNTVADAVTAETKSWGNGWIEWFAGTAGNFSTNYVARDYIAQRLYLALDGDLARYPTYTKDTVGPNLNLQIEADQAYLMTFSGKPPVDGFWSITAYDENQYLIPNGLNRQSIGTANNITYSDGVSVYRGTPNDMMTDGPFEILLQPADAYPPSNWTNNWLPVVPGGGQFSATLRWYGPTPDLDEYVYPILTKIDAITA